MNEIQRIAKIDARGWKNRNPRATLEEQVIQNHYSMSRDRGYLGAAPRATTGNVWQEYHATFLAEIRRRP